MTKTDQVEFNITFSKTQITEEDYMARQLLSELRELDVESAELTKGGTAPAGTKGDPFSIGSIALELSRSLLPSVLGLVQAWV
jgi:hypothetical protein